MTPPLLAVEGLTAAYDAVEVLHGIDLAVDAGELVTVLGANGAGKTTLLRTISGLHTAGAGRVRFDGADVTSREPHAIARRGLLHVPEGRKLFPRMTVVENLGLGAMPGRAVSGVDDRLAAMLARFPILARRALQTAGTLSGGEQQQLAIARGLMGEPRLLLLDEPTLGLAPVLAREILETVASLHADGLAVLLVSQEVVGALEIADRAYVLENGRVVIDGPAAEVAAREDVQGAYLGL